MITKCLLDCDEVLCDFVAPALRLHGLPDPYANPQNLGNYNLESICGITDREAFWGVMTEEFWEALPLLPWAREVVDLVTAKFGEENICLLTKPVRTRGCESGKRAWIERHFPQFSRRYLIGPNKTFCASPTSVLIDDSDANCKAFSEAGGYAVTFPRPWNALHYLAAFPVGYLQDRLEALLTVEYSDD